MTRTLTALAVMLIATPAFAQSQYRGMPYGDQFGSNSYSAQTPYGQYTAQSRAYPGGITEWQENYSGPTTTSNFREYTSPGGGYNEYIHDTEQTANGPYSYTQHYQSPNYYQQQPNVRGMIQEYQYPSHLPDYSGAAYMAAARRQQQLARAFSQRRNWPFTQGPVTNNWAHVERCGRAAWKCYQAFRRGGPRSAAISLSRSARNIYRQEHQLFRLRAEKYR